eukprot:CAMPEP_0172682200 /NCGR_PEP_ID=MMETSP1074-20121228/18001_1 /TAXON_ID=2916 /ORGANISM="Ceratium fusus, Strain PA161109" /LENGTH=49 /DNA_ID= /DNA_START= /DNA_END= /DNA_ORIENTATION=
MDVLLSKQNRTTLRLLPAAFVVPKAPPPIPVAARRLFVTGSTGRPISRA